MPPTVIFQMFEWESEIVHMETNYSLHNGTSEPSLFIVEKFQHSSDHPILKYFSFDTHFLISFKHFKI